MLLSPIILLVGVPTLLLLLMMIVVILAGYISALGIVGIFAVGIVTALIAVIFFFLGMLFTFELPFFAVFALEASV